MFLRSQRIHPPQLLEEAMSISRPSLPSAETIKHMEASSLLGTVLAAGLRTLLVQQPRPNLEGLRSAMEVAGRLATHQLEKYLSALATIASVAPLLGLLGTVIGMIDIFGSQSGSGASGTNPTMLAHGISVALYNTAFGLIVAIPSLIFWRYFRAKVDELELSLEQSCERFYQHIKVHCRPE